MSADEVIPNLVDHLKAGTSPATSAGEAAPRSSDGTR